MTRETQDAWASVDQAIQAMEAEIVTLEAQAEFLKAKAEPFFATAQALRTNLAQLRAARAAHGESVENAKVSENV